jgi:outer membrane protein
MRSINRPLVLLVLLVCAFVPLHAQPETVPAGTVNIGIVLDGPWERNDEILGWTREEIRTLTDGEFEVRFPQDAILVGDWTLDTIRGHVHQLLEDPKIDLVIAWGLISSHSLCCFDALPKPVIAPVVVDPQLQGLPLVEGASGVANLSYVSLPSTFGEELQAFRAMLPFDKVAILANQAFLAAIPDLLLRIRGTLQEMPELQGLEVEFVPVGMDAEAALERLSDDVEAVYLYPQPQLPPAALRRLIEGINDRALPSFSSLGWEMELGAMATYAGEDFFPRLARRVALNVQRILLGEEPGQIPVAFPLRRLLVINAATVRQIDASPRWEFLIEAEILNGGLGSAGPPLGLQEAVREALDANLDLLAQRRAVAAGEQAVAGARAVLRPRLEVSGRGVVIDEDRAAASFGSQPQRAVTGSVGLSQLLYSDPARANVQIQRQIQITREQELAQLRLDIALETAVAYLNLLRAETLEQIQRNNLALTRSHLDLARIRRSIGTANPAEVYRWESQIASDRKALIDADASKRVARIQVNRLLHRALEEPFSTAEVGLDDPSLVSGQERFGGHTETPKHYALFNEFMVLEGLAGAPELLALEAAIVAQERAVRTARRAFYSPTVAAQVTLDERLVEGGAGTGGTLPGGFLTPPDDTSWSLGLSFSLPLFTGGERKAERIQGEEELERLRQQRDSVAEKIEQRIRSGLQSLRASYFGIVLSRQSAAAAARNLELVADAYGRGAVSILDLLDAQNVALNADQRAANAVSDFFIDMMEVERAANRFDFFLGREAQDAWYDRLDAHYRAAGLELAQPGELYVEP